MISNYKIVTEDDRIISPRHRNILCTGGSIENLAELVDQGDTVKFTGAYERMPDGSINSNKVYTTRISVLPPVPKVGDTQSYQK